MGAIRSCLLAALMGLLLVGCGGGGQSQTRSEVILGNDVGEGGTGGDGSSQGDDLDIIQMGSGSGTDFTLGQLRADQTTIDAGGSTTIYISMVDENNIPISDYEIVTFSSGCAALGLSDLGGLDTLSSISMRGLASVTYTANGCSGTDTITASAEVWTCDNSITTYCSGRLSTITAAVNIEVLPDEILGVQFIETSASQLSLSGLGGLETATLSFRLVGSRSAPIVGEDVQFSVESTVGEARIADSAVSDESDSSGVINTVLQSGTAPAVVRVRATHVASGISGVSSDIVVSTGIPVQSRLSLSTDHNISNAWDTDGVSVTLNVYASDQYGHPAPNGTQILFRSPESGQITPSCTIAGGSCAVTWTSSDPRPADGRFGVVAYTQGAEDFTDNNGNNVYDGSDSFSTSQDLDEPYVDEDEDGSYDLGEDFVDSNDNGVWDVADGVWNGPCLSGIDATALCPGATEVAIFETTTMIMPTDFARILDFGDFPSGGAGSTLGTIDISGLADDAQQNVMNLILVDSNAAADALGSNPLPVGTTFSFTTANGSIEQEFGGAMPDSTSPYAWPVGIRLSKDATPSSGTLTLTVTTPGGDETYFYWTIVD